MERRFKFCVRCRRTVTDSEVRRGLYVETRDGLYCATCARSLDEPEDIGSATTTVAKPIGPLAQAAKLESFAKPGLKPAEKPSSAAEPARPVEKPVPPPAPTGAPAAAPPGTARLEKELTALREAVETIQRVLLFEKTSAWNVAAAVAQCLALGMLLVAGLTWLEGEGAVLNVLLIAVVFQLMALTFFVKAK